MELLTKLCGCCCILSTITAIILIAISFKSLDINEYGLDYSSVSKTIEPKALQGGIHFLGVGHSFIKYPSTFQTIEFSRDANSNGGSIRSRTSDGLEVAVEISFQYRLNYKDLFDLYMTFENKYNLVFQKYAIDILTEQTTFYTAYEFFMDRTSIGVKMQNALNEVFTKKLYSTIEFFQLRSVDLPDKFEQSIQESEVKKQDIQKAYAERNKTIVELKTQLMSADYQRNVTINMAKGDAKAILAQANANANSYKQVQNQMTSSYQQLKSATSMTNTDLLDYIKAKLVREFKGDNMMVGLSKVDA